MTRIFHVPIGRWQKNKGLKMVGLSWRAILLDGTQPIALGPLTKGLKWSPEQVETRLVEVRKGYMDDMNREDHCTRILKDFGLLVISGRIKAMFVTRRRNGGRIKRCNLLDRITNTCRTMDPNPGPHVK